MFFSFILGCRFIIGIDSIFPHSSIYLIDQSISNCSSFIPCVCIASFNLPLSTCSFIGIIVIIKGIFFSLVCFFRFLVFFAVSVFWYFFTFNLFSLWLLNKL